MFKKLVLGGLLVALIGILVVGGVIRTLDKTGQVAEARSLEGQARGNGRGAGNVERESSNPLDLGNWLGKLGADLGDTEAQGAVGQGLGATGERLYPNYETAPETWLDVEGVVVQAPEAGQDLIIQTADGKEVLVGTGPGYMEAQSFSLQVGEQVQIRGYWEDDELKASQITRLRDGQTITLRDDYGRPAWSGSGRNQTAAGGQGQGRVDLADPLPGEAARRNDSAGEGLGVGQAEVGEWLTFQGTVTSVTSGGLLLALADSGEISLTGRPWRFIQEQGGVFQAGDTTTLTAFYEGSDIEVGQIVNEATGQSITVRDENGRPLWAGQGRRNS